LSFLKSISECTESLPKNDPRLRGVIGSLSTAARWAKLPAEQEIYDRMDLELARNNPNQSDTWLFSALSAVAFDLYQQGGTERLEEAEAMVREAITIALKVLPDSMDRAQVRAYICSMYIQLARILLATAEPEKAHAEIVNLIAFNANNFKDIGADFDYTGLGDAYEILLQISKLYLSHRRYDDGVRLAKEAIAVLPSMIDQASPLAPSFLSEILETISGHKPVVETALDQEPDSSTTAKS